jgi:predicted transposase YdaD
MLERNDLIDAAEKEELMAALSPAYLEWERETKERGRQEGRQEGERSLVLRLLTRRVGEVPDEMRLQVEALSLEQLELLGEALLDFTAIIELEAWL